MTAVKLFILATLFVVSSGSLFSSYFKKHRKLNILVSVFAILSTYYLLDSVYLDIVSTLEEPKSKIKATIPQLKDENGMSLSSIVEVNSMSTGNDITHLKNDVILGKDTNAIYIDYKNKLMWQVKPKWATNWDDAVRIAKSSKLGGYKDWRLPIELEIRSIYKCKNYYDCKIISKLDGRYKNYWTNIDLNHDIGGYFDTSKGKGYFSSVKMSIMSMNKSYPGAVRIVRDI